MCNCAESVHLRAALEDLVTKLDAIFSSDDYLGTFALAVAHGAVYRGPDCSEELSKARALLKRAKD